MKKNLFFVLALFIIGFFYFPSISSAQDVSSVVSANNRFACELYSQYKTKDGNIFFSPYSISFAMAMVYEGARGETAEEMRAVFHFSQDAASDREAFRSIYQTLNGQRRGPMLVTANAVWAQKEYPFLESYFHLIETYYGGKAASLDFANEGEASRLTINSWVKEQTNNKVSDLIPSGVLGSSTRLVVTNAVYFKGFWDKLFRKSDTKEEDFRLSSGGTVKTPMMHLGEERLNYAETDKLQILELLYEKRYFMEGFDFDEISMLIFLPKDDDLSSLEESLDAENISQWTSSLREEKVLVSLPRFKFETTYYMAKDLQSMGMPAAFSPGIDHGGKADFSGMTGKKDLNIDEVIHKAFVDVDEKGTEAAAATAAIGLTGWAGGVEEPRQPKIFKADHPFIFIIQYTKTHHILFIGRVSDPTK